MVGQYKVMDAHCHVYPATIASKAVGGTDAFYGVTSVYDGTVETLLDKEMAAGVDHCVIQSVATTPKQVKSINEFIARTVAEGEGRFTGLGTLHPDSADLAGDVAHILELGLKGVKMHPDIQAFRIDDERCQKIYALCQEHRLPVLLHTGDDRYDYSNPNRLLPMLEEYKDLTFIGAHLAGYSIWEEACDKLGHAPNLYVDCSSSFFRLTAEKAEELIRRWGADRVLFGTDYPMWAADKELATLLSMHFSEVEFRKILWDNAYNLFVK